MYGAYLTQLGNYISAKLGGDSWQQILEQAKVPLKIYIPNQTYSDEEMESLVQAATLVAGMSRNTLLENLGEYMVPDMMNIYGSLIEPSWRTLDVLENLPEIIERVQATHESEQIEHPTFSYQRTGPDRLQMTYSSSRHLCGLAKGMIKGFARYFSEQVVIKEAFCMDLGSPACQIIVDLLPVETPPDSNGPTDLPIGHVT